MISRDRGLDLGEQRIEIVSCPAMRMLLMGLARHQFDHIHHLDLKVGKDGGEGCPRRREPNVETSVAQAMIWPREQRRDASKFGGL